MKAPINDQNLDELLRILDEDEEPIVYDISYPIYRLGPPSPQVAEMLFEMSRTGNVRVITALDAAEDVLWIRADAGRDTVSRAVHDKSKIQEELLAALISLQLGK
jgi:hypothetical protein